MSYLTFSSPTSFTISIRGADIRWDETPPIITQFKTTFASTTVNGIRSTKIYGKEVMN